MKNKLLVAILSILLTGQLFSNSAIQVDQNFKGIQLDPAIFQNGIRTIDFWFQPSSDLSKNTFAEYQSLIVRDNLSQHEEWGFYLNHTDGTLRFFRRVATQQYEIISDTVNWFSNQLYHVVGVIDGATGMSLYINGTKQLDTNSSPEPIMSNSDVTAIGTWGNLNIRHFKGTLDNVRMWSRALTPAEVSTLDCALPQGLLGDLALNLDMEQISLSNYTVTDVSSNSLTLYFQGTMTVVSNNWCSTPTSTIKQAINQQVYPNPTAGTVYFPAGIETIEVYNSIGELMSVLSAETVRFDLPKGLYLLKLIAAGGQVSVNRLIVQ